MPGSRDRCSGTVAPKPAVLRRHGIRGRFRDAEIRHPSRIFPRCAVRELHEGHGRTREDRVPEVEGHASSARLMSHVVLRDSRNPVGGVERIRQGWGFSAAYLHPVPDSACARSSRSWCCSCSAGHLTHRGDPAALARGGDHFEILSAAATKALAH
jgi:hypothetical protein